MNQVAQTLLNSSLSTAIAQINARLDTLEAYPKLKALERHKEYYSHSSIHGGNILKEHALLVCAQADEDSVEYQALVLPLVERIETFFNQPDHFLDFADQVRMVRARRLIDQGKYKKAAAVYANIAYSPIYATAFEQRNRYFVNAAKIHLHIIKKLSRPKHVIPQLLQALEALHFANDYPHKDDIQLYQNAAAMFAQNYYEEAKMLITKISEQQLPEYIKHMNQNELLAVYKTLFVYKSTLNHEASNLEILRHASPWYNLIKNLQKNFIALMFETPSFHQPDKSLMPEAHALLNEPTTTVGQIQHLVGNTKLEKCFISALIGNAAGVQTLRQFGR